MAVSRAPVFCLVVVSLFILLLYRSHPLDFKEIVFWGGRVILILALVTLAISVLAPYFSSFLLPAHSTTVPQRETEKQKESVRLGQQEYLNKKAIEYSEDVLKPRKAEKFKRLEEKFYKMTGQSWKLTAGQRLGEAEDSTGNLDIVNHGIETANKEAIRKRKYPDYITKPMPKAEQPQPKKVITLPEEPNELEEGVVTIALRCPSGRVYKRRFYIFCTSLVLLDWMLTIGYHPEIYTICKPFPRSCLEPREDLTLENIGITKHTVLNVDKKDDL